MEKITLVDWIGIDTGKENLDVAVRRDSKPHRTLKVSNKQKGFHALLEFAIKHARPGAELRFCLESTGDYGTEFALFVTDLGYHVSIVNPNKVKHYGAYKGRLNKTDKADAKLIADFATDSNPEAWGLADPDKRKLFRLHRRRQQLIKIATAELNRRECPGAIGPECMASIKAILKLVRSEIRAMNALMRTLVQSNPEFKAQQDLIVTIPALAEGSAHVLIAEMPPVEKCESAKAYAAAAGGHPCLSQSGNQNKPGRMSRGGRRAVRKQLWMPVQTSLGRMPELRDLYDRLRKRGKKHHQAQMACVRKLLLIVYGVLNSKKPYQAPKPYSELPAGVCVVLQI